MKFKAEIVLLVASIALFSISALCFSYVNGAAFAFPLREYALPFVGFGGAFMMVASISYSKRSKTCI